MDENTKRRFEIPEKTEKTQKSDKYLINIDTVCKTCGYRNVGQYKLDVEMPIVCCGACGEFLVTPEGMNDSDKEAMQLCVQQALEEQAEEEKK